MRSFYRYLLSLFSILIGLSFLCWSVWLVLHDVTLWNKDLSMILFGSRVGELMDLGLGFKGIHYLVLGIILVIVPFLKRGEDDSNKIDSVWEDMTEEFKKKD